MASDPSFALTALALQAMNVPLAITSYKTEPVALGLGMGLSAILARLTTQKPSEGVTSEIGNALSSLVMTSPLNRAVRISMGIVYLYAACRFADRDSKDWVGSPLNWAGTLMLCFAGVLWLSTGFYGQ
mmetsp:Transcript_74711/g.173054  ORF Transcript_74711/g.173054 Transcript_74711/m.173054 type:complete len:128 (-) Transcript_74711:289-672(-)